MWKLLKRAQCYVRLRAILRSNNQTYYKRMYMKSGVYVRVHTQLCWLGSQIDPVPQCQARTHEMILTKTWSYQNYAWRWSTRIRERTIEKKWNRKFSSCTFYAVMWPVHCCHMCFWIQAKLQRVKAKNTILTLSKIRCSEGLLVFIWRKSVNKRGTSGVIFPWAALTAKSLLVWRQFWTCDINCYSGRMRVRMRSGNVPVDIGSKDCQV